MASIHKYSKHTAVQLAADAAFIAWVKHPDEAGNVFWNAYLEQYPQQREALEKATLIVKGMQINRDVMVPERAEKLWNRISENILTIPSIQPSGRVIRFRSWMWAAAILIAVLFSAGFFLRLEKEEIELAGKSPKTPATPYILPGGNKAILTLGDGSSIVLDGESKDTLNEQGGITIIQLDGRLAYNQKDHTSTEVVYNSIQTPKGGQYQIVLEDGTRVWLNALSSIRFPASFTGTSRKVEITGEAYFEVAHDDSKPFLVRTGDMEVSVLGTHFNINAYSDEETVKTTLLQGAVRVSKGSDFKLLQPGQQALVNASGKLDLKTKVNLEEVVAWKNGKFHFSNADLKTVMRQLSNWYDVEVEYSSSIPHRVFEGEMQRDLMLHQVLKILENNNVRFKVTGKKILVMP